MLNWFRKKKRRSGVHHHIPDTVMLEDELIGPLVLDKDTMQFMANWNDRGRDIALSIDVEANSREQWEMGRIYLHTFLEELEESDQTIRTFLRGQQTDIPVDELIMTEIHMDPAGSYDITYRSQKGQTRSPQDKLYHVQGSIQGTELTLLQ